MAEERTHSRLAFVDLARGLAVLLMLQTHAYDAWLRPELRETSFFRWSQFIGGLPAAFFLFLMGVSGALASDRARSRGTSGADLVTRGLKRAGLLFMAAFAFQISMYLVSDRPRFEAIFHVNILNCLAVSLALLSLLDLVSHHGARLFTAISVAFWIAMVTPFVWDGGLVGGLPERVAGYLTGRVANTTFPIFPWTAFAFAGYSVGWLIGTSRAGLGRGMAWLFGLGVGVIPLSRWLDQQETMGPRYDYWWTSPNFILYKVGVLILLLLVCYLFDRASWAARSVLGWALRAFSTALIQMGRTSLFIYCLHVDIVYGSRALPKLWRSCEIDEASRNLALLALVMLGLSYVWVWVKGKTTARTTAPVTPANAGA